MTTTLVGTSRTTVIREGGNAVEGNDDHFYLGGNNAVTLYRYSISGNSWSTLAPGAARAGAYATGGTLDWIDGVRNASWNDGSYGAHYTTTLLRQSGRYLYGFRGGASSTLDVYDIAANTWISGIAYGNQQPTFTTGTTSVDIEGAIYLQKEATGVIYRFSVADNELQPWALNPYPQGAALVGDKMVIMTLREGATDIHYLYTLSHTRSELTRWLMIQPIGEYPRTGIVAIGDFAAGG